MPVENRRLPENEFAIFGLRNGARPTRLLS